MHPCTESFAILYYNALMPIPGTQLILKNKTLNHNNKINDKTQLILKNKTLNHNSKINDRNGFMNFHFI